MIRKDYFEEVLAFRDKQIIKVITGLRRCGKSLFMEQIIAKYLADGIHENQIIYYRLDELENEKILDYKTLYETIKARLVDNKKNYIFLDEIQLCPEFQKAVDSLYNKKNTDIYLTGSNSDLLSGEIVTLLSGRYITINMQPFSFSEYLKGREENDLPVADLEQCYYDYVRYGSLPFTVQLKSDERNIHQYLNGVYNTILLKDISVRHQINDISNLEAVIRFIFANTANICTSKKISDTLTSGGRKVSQPTVENYMRYLEECFMVYRVERYDIKGKEYLKTLCKYYIADTGLRNMLLGYRNIDSGHILETLVFLEFKRRKYEIYTGKIGDMEIDFVARTPRSITYIQVAESVKDEATLERELKPFRKLKDAYPCVLITLDKTLNEDFDGVKHINALDFFMGQL
ncbi:MAG: ATP-binding protein [Treponemataceae bacterium]|nr:ATP-binding protein [Treponemataceae bacterium]